MTAFALFGSFQELTPTDHNLDRAIAKAARTVDGSTNVEKRCILPRKTMANPVWCVNEMQGNVRRGKDYCGLGISCIKFTNAISWRETQNVSSVGETSWQEPFGWGPSNEGSLKAGEQQHLDGRTESEAAIVIAEKAFAAGYRRIVDPTVGKRCGRLLVVAIPGTGGLFQAYDQARRREGLAIRIPADERLPRELPRSDKVAMRTEPDENQSSVFLVLERTPTCKESTFFTTAYLVARTFQEADDFTAQGFFSAAEEWMHGKRRPPSITYEKQAGLMGELHVIERDLLPFYPETSTISFWKGPFASAKDFVLPTCCIEVKATKASEDWSFWVSNDDQFLKPETTPMFLRFITFREHPTASETVAEAVERLSDRFSRFPAARDAFIRAVKKAGYNPNHRLRYRKLARFALDEDLCFRVDALFPRLSLQSMQTALNVKFVGAIKYSIRIGALFDLKLKEDRQRYLSVVTRKQAVHQS